MSKPKKNEGKIFVITGRWQLPILDLWPGDLVVVPERMTMVTDRNGNLRPASEEG